MTTAYTSLLGLALPVTGELSGTWGDTVNNSITSLLDSAIAGTQTVTADTTLTTTTGAANQSRQAILLCSPASANITITAPAQSKIYTVINTSAVYTVTIRGVGPTTGVTLAVSESAVVAWNGSDFIRISSNSATTGNFTVNGNLSVTGNTTLGDAATDTVTVNGYMGVGVAASASTALLVGSPTLTGTTQRGVDAATTFGTGATASVQQIRAISTLTTAGVYAEWIGLNVPQPQGTGYTLTNAYGLYISDQTKGTNNYGITSAVTSGTNKYNIYASGTAQNYFAGNVGIGINPPAAALDVSGAPAGALSRFANTTAPTLDNSTHAGEAIFLRSGGTAGSGNVQAVLAFGKADGSSIRTGSAIASVQNTADADQVGIGFYTSPGTGSTQTLTQQMLLDYAGNLGLGVTPSAWGSALKALQINYSAIWGNPANTTIRFSTNTYNNGTNFIYLTSNYATYYAQDSGNHIWYNAPSGTAATTATFTQAMTLDANGSLGVGATSLTGYNLRISKNITGATTSYGVSVDGTIQSDVTSSGIGYETSLSSTAAAFTLSDMRHFDATQATIGAGSIVTSQHGFITRSTLTGATNNSSFYGNLAAPTSGITTTGTITSISSSTTAVTVNHNAITYTNGQTVTISATANATALVSGATCTILTVGTTDFTLIGAASNTVGVSFTATGAGTGTGTVTLNVQGSGKTVAGAASGSFTYTTTTSQTFTAVTVLTGSVTVSNRWNLYMAGTADNYFRGSIGIEETSPASQLVVSDASTDARILIQHSGTGNALTDGLLLGAIGSNFYVYGYDAYPLIFGTSGTERMRIDSSGNVGIGVTPSAWSTTLKPIEIGNIGTYIAGRPSGNQLDLGVNNYYNAGYKYANTGVAATQYEQTAGTHAWYTAASGTAGNAITFTQAMTLDASGRLLVGATSATGAINKFTVGTGLTTTNAVAVVNTANANIDGLSISNWDGSTTTYGPKMLFANSGRGTFFVGGSDGAYNFDIARTWGTPDLRIDSSGNVGIGTTSPTAVLMLKAGTATASTAPLKLTSGTNLTTPEAGAVEYDGTVFYGTTDTNFKRGTLPITNYTSGTGTALGTNTEATNAVLLPTANDTITLSVGTYFLDVSYIVTRGATSTTSATARINIRGSGAAVGNFSGMSLSAPTAGGATANFSFDAVNITTDNVLTAASTTAAGVYTISLRGILKITTSGTIIPQYSLSANINAAGTVAKVLYFRLQQLDTQSAAAAGPAGTGWA